jgi:hypothetical protein
MSKNKTRGIIGIIVTTIFMLTCTIMALYAFANDLEGVVDKELTITYMKEYFSLFSGTIGVIIGYYFGVNQKQSESKS